MPENSICHEIDTGKHYYLANGEWHQLPARGGGEGLPDNFPTEGSENANKFLGFDANGDYTAKDAPAGGGAEKFIVTLTESNDTWTADKTVAEIVAADEAGKIVVCKLRFDEMPFTIEIPMNGATPNGAVIFGGASKDLTDPSANSVYTAIGMEERGVVDWSVTISPIPTSSNAPLIVTMTLNAPEDPEEPASFVGDKTYGEVFTAASAGTPCTIVLSAEGANVATPVLSAVSSNGTIMLFTYDTDSSSITSIQGSGSDYVTIAIS